MTPSIASWVFPMACPSCSERTANPVATARTGESTTVTIRCAVCLHAWDQATKEPPAIQMRTPRSAFEKEVANRFGVLPNFFCTAETVPELIPELWKFATAAYLGSPLPSLFKERLFVHLSRFCRVRYCIVRHVGFLTGRGRPAGDAAATPETVQQVIEMLRRSAPEIGSLTAALGRLEQMSEADALPESGTAFERDLFDALTVMFVSPVTSARARACVRRSVGDATFELLVAFLAFVRTAHYWTEMHPELAFEADMVAMLSEHRELAELCLDSSEAELQRSWTLRETIERSTF